ncbi:dienelactone hydrolase family protein [Parvularcula sp. IMCC14364]|uniref:dienelactone hydrolase family protein n=1 Tax=Parvularcula sp. IMCC14364 TaxID=3067902 RepID=UPI0027409BEE|nr:dienelactone hydrolase family protein [Parvularcula sp. IMCC14364]
MASTPPTRRALLASVTGAVAAGTVPVGNASATDKSETVDYPPFATRELFKSDDITHPVYIDGTGPGVLLMHELPGMVPEFWRFAHWLKEAGFTVFAPDLYEDKLRGPTPPSLSANLARACISREIHLFAQNASSPVTQWLRKLATHIHEQCGGPGVGAIGMCMTGNFALSLVLDAPVIAPVASQPAMPISVLSRRSRAALHMSAKEKQALQERKAVDVMALRFKGDPSCTKARFDAIEALVGPERFNRIELDDRHQNPDGNPFPHAVLTRDLIDAEGSATLAARDAVFSFLQSRLIETP